MPYQWNVDVEALFAERRPQMINRGLPEVDVDALAASSLVMWGDGPGCWVHEWSALGDRYVERGEMAQALLAYGYAKFPTLADEPRRQAFKRQVELCVELGASEPIPFERRIVNVETKSEVVPVTVHQYSPPDRDASQAPVLLASGGVDMWKDDLHGTWGAFATWAGVSVLAFDIPGTGESTVSMSVESAEVVSGLVAEARQIGNGRVAHLGISMGGYFAARTGLTGEVDAAVVLGGPVEAAFESADLAGAMGGILGNTLGFDSAPTDEELAQRWMPMSLGPLLAQQPSGTPMLVVNGADDHLVPQHDTMLFDGRPGAEAHLIPDAGHCAPEKLGEVIPMIMGWLGRTLAAGDQD